MAFAMFRTAIRLLGRTMWFSTRLKLLTMPVTALPKFSETVMFLMLRVAIRAAGPTLNIGRSITVALAI